MLSSQNPDELSKTDWYETNKKNNSATVIEMFIRVWKNERSSPDIQIYRQDLMDQLFLILSMEETHANELYQNVNVNSESAFFSKMITIDMERLRFMIKNYLTIRLQKVCV
jgi:hypothetical protein